MTKFTEPEYALEEAGWLADMTGWRHAIVNHGDNLGVVKLHRAKQHKLEILEIVG